MPATVSCPQCGKNLNVPDAMLGQRGRCPSCNHVFVLSAAGIQAAPPPVPPRPPASDSAYSPNMPGMERSNDFEDFRAGREAVYTPPGTFNKLFFWYLGLTVTEIVVALVLVVVLVAVAAIGAQAEQTFQKVGNELNNGRPVRGSNTSSGDAAVGLILLPVVGVILLFSIAQLIIYYTLIYKAWALIQDGNPRTTPGKAVGFSFIPFFNLYWMFVAIRGLSEDLNQYANRRGMVIREASVGLTTAYLVVFLCNMVPCVNYVAGIPTLVLQILSLNTIRCAAADIATAKGG